MVLTPPPNTQYARGAQTQTGALTETFHGNGLSRNFTLSYEIASAMLKDLPIPPPSTARPKTIVGTKGDSGDAFDVAVGYAVVAQDTGEFD